MKVYLNNYKDNWISPYTVKEKFFFWKKGYDAHENEPPVWLTKICEGYHWVANKLNRRINYVKIDYWDTWSMDATLAPIILPMLKQLRASKSGAPWVDDEDVPEELKSTSAPPKENSWDTDDNFFKRWEWILDEEIWAFEQLQPGCDWEAQYFTGNSDTQWEKQENGCSKMVKGPRDTSKWDKEGYTAHQARISRGTALFGKYYSAHWD